MRFAGGECQTQRLARSEQVRLPCEVFQCARTEAVGQWSCGFSLLEQGTYLRVFHVCEIGSYSLITSAPLGGVKRNASGASLALRSIAENLITVTWPN